MRYTYEQPEYLDISGARHLVQELRVYIQEILEGNIDITQYVTQSELQAKLDALDINIDLSSYATKEELTDVINSIDLSDYALKTEIPTVPTKTSQLTNDSGFLTQHQDLSAYATKDEIPTVPSKVSELTNDSNYQTAEQVNSTVTTEIAKVVADAPEDLNTLKEMSDWIAGHEDDASAMNSAISDNKIAITALQTGKADKSEIPTTLPANGGNADTVNNHTVKSDVPENAVFTDTIYDDTELNAKLGEKADTDKVAKKIYIRDTSSQDARTLIQNHWSEFDRFEFYNLHIDTAKWAWDAEIYAHTQEYGTVLLRSYGSDVPSVFYGKLYNGVWTWKEIATMDKVESKYEEATLNTPVDWNTLNTKARYYVSGGEIMTNAPMQQPFGELVVETAGDGSVCRVQKFFSFDGRLYMRRWTGSIWNEWYRFDGISI